MKIADEITEMRKLGDGKVVAEPWDEVGRDS